MKRVMVMLMYLQSHQAWAVPCSSSSLVPPMVVKTSTEATQLAEAVNCSGGIFSVEWKGRVTLDREIKIGTNTSLEVIGETNGASYVDGMDEHPLFQTDGGELRLYNLTLTNGNGEDGGAISAKHGADIAVNNCNFTANNANRGGAIYINNSTMRTLGYTVFERNVGGDSGGAVFGIVGSTGGINGGGGIQACNRSTVDVFGTVVFEQNNAFKGGALMIGELSVLTVFGTMTVDSNTATSSGGGIYTRREACINFSGNSSVSLFNNSAENGGGIGILESSMFIAGDVTMEANTATSSGGAVYSDGSETAAFENAYFLGNTAGESGGAIAMISAGSELNASNVDNCSFEDNEAGDSGGAIYLTGGFVRVTNSRFSSNTAGKKLFVDVNVYPY